MKNIHVLPTDNPSRIVKNDKNLLKLCIQTLPLDKEINCFPQNIYITSDEEIKEGDYCIDGDDIYGPFEEGDIATITFIKIILTTDEQLIRYGVQSIDNEFLEWFVKNPSCEAVYVELIDTFKKTNNVYVDEITGGNYYEIIKKYKITIPTEEPKQELERGITITNKQETFEESNQTTAIRFLEWYRRRNVIYQFHCYHIPNINDKNWKKTVFNGDNSYLNSNQLFEIFKKENYDI